MQAMRLIGVVIATWTVTAPASWGQTTQPAPETAPSATAPTRPSRRGGRPATTSATATAPAPAATQPAPVTTMAPAATQPATAAAPATRPAPTTQAAPATVPAVATAPAKPAPVKNFKFAYRGTPYREIILSISRESNRPIFGDLNVDGELTFVDSELYTFQDAMDILNVFLATRGQHLREDGHWLRLEPLTATELKPLTAEQVQDPNFARPLEIVTVVIPLKSSNLDMIRNALVRLVSPWGQMVILPRGKGLVITDTVKRIEYIRSFIQLMDLERLTDWKLLSHPLERASAAEVARTVDRLFGYQPVLQRLRGMGREGAISQSELDYVVTSIDSRSNTLFLMGTGESLQKADEMATMLDKKGDTRELIVIDLKSAKAEDVVRQITPGLPPARVIYMQDQPPRFEQVVRVVADPIGNRILLSGEVQHIENVRKMIEALDKGGPTEGMKIFALKFTDAQQMAGILSNSLRKSDAPGRRAMMLLNITAEPQSNRLIVYGTPGDVKTAEDLVRELDQPADANRAARMVKVVHLAAGNARELATSLVRLFSAQTQGRGDGSGTALRVEAETATNSLLISVLPDYWPTVSRILDDLKANVTQVGTPETRQVPVKFVKASDLASALRPLFDTRRNVSRGQMQTVPVIIAPSPSNNSLLISASADDQAILAGLIKDMDVEGGAVDPIRTIYLTAADPEKVAVKLRAMLPPPRGAEPDVSIQADRLAKCVWVRAPEGKWKMIQETIGQLDEASRQWVREMRQVPLANASASAVVGTLSQVYQSAVSGGRGAQVDPAEQIILAAAPGDRTIVVEAPKGRMEDIVKLAQSMDVAGAGSLQVKTYQLAHSNAPEVARTLARLFAEAPSRRQPTSGELQPKFEADASTNQLIVAATDAQFKEIEPLIQKLQDAPIVAGQVATFPLKFARAADLAPVLQTMLADSGTQRMGVAASAAGVRVAAVPGTNTIVVQGLSDKLKIAKDLIDQFDREGIDADHPVVRVYQLAASNAAETAASLQRLFASQGGRQQRGIAPEVQPRFEYNSAANQLIVSATESQFKDIEPLIKEIKDAVLDTQTRTFPLKFAQAGEVASVLQMMLASSSGGRGGTGQAPARVAALSATNAVIVQGPADKIAAAEDLLKAMDREEPGGSGLVHIIRLENASATDVANALRASLPQPARGAQGPDISIQAEPRSNTVLLRAPEAQRKVMEKLIEDLDKSVLQAREVRVLRLEHTSAAAVTNTLNQLYAGPRGQARGGDDRTRVVIVSTPDDRSIVIDAPRGGIDLIAKMAKDLDSPEGTVALLVKTYAITSGSAPEVAASLTRLFATPRGQQAAAGRPDARFEGNPSTNQLIVAASPSQFEEIERLLKDMEAAPGGQTKTYELKFAKAADLMPVMQSMLTPAAGGRGGAASNARVAVAPGGNALVVQGPADKMALADKLIETFDTEKFAPHTAVQIVTLKNAQADTLARSVSDSLGRNPRQADPAQQVTVIAETNSNSVLVRGPAADLPDVVKTIHELDQTSPSPDSVENLKVELFLLKNSDATELAKSITKFFQDTIQTPARSRKGGIVPPFSASADTRTNTLVVCTTAGHFAMVDNLVKQLDGVEPPPIQPMQYYPLSSADATDVVRQVNLAFAMRPARDRPVVEADTYSNAVTVIAKDEDFKTIESLITTADKIAERTRVQIRVMTVKGRADKMAETLQRVYGQISGGEVRIINQVPLPPAPDGAKGLFPLVLPEADANSGFAVLSRAPAATQPATARATSAPATGPAGLAEEDIPPRPPVNIAVDRNSNALIVSGTRTDLAAIESLVERLSQGGDADAEFRIFVMKDADAVSVARTLDDLFNPRSRLSAQLLQQMQGRGQQVQQGRGRPGQPQPQPQPAQIAAALPPPPSISVVADPATKSVIVRAKPVDFELIEPLIKHMDQRQTVNSIVKVFPLQNTDATEVANNLRELFQAARQQTGGRQGGQNPMMAQQAALIRQMIELRQADGVTQVDVSAGINISANRLTNSVVVAAPEDAVKVVGQIIAELDQNAGLINRAVVKIYPLKNAEVRATAQVLQDIFVQGAAGATGQGGRGPRGGGGAAGTAAASDRVVISSDEIGRRIIVLATAEKHETIAEFIAMLDAPGAGVETSVQVYRLLNADATTVVPALQTTLVETTGTGGATGPRGARGGGSTSGGGMRISADRSSNSIIVRGTKDEQAKVAEIIARLDTVPAEVLVRVIPLNRADPTDVATTLRNVFAGGGGAAGQAARPRGAAAQGGAGAGAIVIEPGPRSLLVRTPDEDTFGKIRALALQLDAGLGTEREVIVLKNAQAASVAASIAAAFPTPRGQRISPDDLVTATAEPSVNAVIVSANAEKMKEIKALVAKLDVEGSGRRTEMLVMKTARAADVAAALSKVIVAQPGGRGGQQQQVVISAETGTNTLIMSGPAGDLDKMMAMALQLDQVPKVDDTQVFVIPLRNGYAADTAKMVQALYQPMVQAAQRDRRSIDPLAVSSDDRANAVVLSTTKGMYEQVLKWIKEVEDLKPALGNPRIIMVKDIDPAEVQKVIDQMFGGRGYSELEAAPPAGRPARPARPAPSPSGAPRGTPASPRGAGTPAGGASKGGRVESTVLPNQKGIMVTASDEDYQLILKIVAEMEKAASKRVHKVFVVKNTTNVRVATAIQTAYAGLRTTRPEDQVSVVAVAQTDAVLVTAIQERLDEIASLIEALDKPEVGPDIQVRTYTLENTQPTKILPTLRQLVTSIQKVRPGEAIDLISNERTRSIIVTARGPVFDQVENLIKELDKPAPKGIVDSDVLIIPLKKADATRLAAVLNDMLRPTATGQVTPEARALQEEIRLLRVRGAAGEQVPDLDLSKPIKVVADPGVAGQQGSNSLLITSTPENLKAMRAVVELLDVFPIAEAAKVRLVHLRNANAASVTTILREIFTQGARLGGKTGSSVAGKAEPESATGKALVNPLNVSSDLRTNTVVLSGQEESLVLAELICKDLDRENGKITTEVRLFRLKNADAMRLMPVLQAVFAEGPAVAGSEGLNTQVTRLRAALENPKEPKVTEIPKGRDALIIRADQTTNILVVAARSDVMPLLADVIATMDVPGAGSLNLVRIFPLANADATRLQQVVNSLYAGPNATFIRSEDKPTVAVDTRTNALIVSASENTFAVLDALLKKLDTKTPVDARDVRIVPLKNSDATTLATTLQRMMDARVQRLAALGPYDAEAARVVLVADARSNALIVGASAESFQLIKGLAEQLDEASPSLSGQIQVFVMKQANAGSVAQTLTNLFNQRYAAARTPDVQRQKPVILPDVRTNSLLVGANADDTAVLQSLLKELDVKLENPSVLLEVIPLKHNDAGVVGPEIRTLFQARLTSMTPQGQVPAPQDRVDLSTDTLANALIVSASRENLDLIKALLEKVDVEPSGEGVVQMFHLKNADATRVSTMLQGLLTRGLYKPGLASAASTPAVQAREKVSLAVDTRTNTLIVSASQENLAILKKIIEQVDSSDAYNVLSDIRVYPLQNADASRMAPSLQQFFNAKRAAEVSAGDTARTVGVSITADARTNSLLVAGNKESFAIVEKMLESLDAKDTPAPAEFKVFQLKHATATVVQPQLTQVFANRPIRGTQPRDPITVVADRQANTLIVGANPEDMKMVESLIERLDAEVTEFSKTQVFVLSKADPTQVATTIRSLYQAAGAGAVSPVTVTTDDRLNAVIVSGGETDLKRAADVIRQLDVDVGKVTEIRVFPLVNADATELATLLTTALTNRLLAPTPVSPNRQMIYQFITSQQGKDLIVSALHEGLLITPDRRTNSLVVAAPAQNMPLLEVIIKTIDSAVPRPAEIRRFSLKNADATLMGTLLSNLFRTTAAATAQRAASVTMVGTKPSGEPAAATANLGTAEQYALVVTVDTRTNSLLVSGTHEYVELAGKIIDEIDSTPGQERMTKVYRLHNARATDIQTALRSFLDQERAQIATVMSADKLGAAQQLLERQVAVVVVPNEGLPENTNTLLLSASPKYFQIVSDMITELDKTPPQVLVQVLLAEVTLSDTTKLGAEWTYTHKPNNLESGTVGTKFGVAGDFATNGGFQVSVTGSEVSFFLRALQNTGRVEELSRPQILTSDNEPAQVKVGQNVPWIQNSRIDAATGAIINTIAYQQIGITLDVTPRISPQGFVKLTVKPSIQTVGASTVQLSTGLNATVFNTRDACTVVTVQDGHTIILGGLITTRDETQEQKVPILGDIPWLGGLFKNTTKVKQRTELLIILTPRILTTPEDLDVVTDEQRKGLKMMRGNGERDLTQETIFTPLEVLVPPKTPATQPMVRPGELIPELRDSPPGAAPATQPAKDKGYD